MKKNFESAEVRVIKFEAMDILTSSILTVSYLGSPQYYISESGQVVNTYPVQEFKDTIANPMNYNGNGTDSTSKPKKSLENYMALAEDCKQKS